MVGLPRPNNSKIDVRSIPLLLIAIKNEPLNHVISLKVQPSLAEFLENHGGPTLIRSFIIEALEKRLDEPKKAVCRKCANLSVSKGEYFCVVICGYLDAKLLDEVFVCDHFQEKAK